MKVLIRALPESGGGGGGLPLPEFFGPFFHQVIVPKKVIFYPKLTIFVGFSVIFVIIFLFIGNNIATRGVANQTKTIKLVRIQILSFL